MPTWRPGVRDAENGRQRRSQSPVSLRPCGDVILSILRDSELNDAQRLFAWALGSETDEERVIPLPRGPLVHIIGQAPTHQLP